MSLRILCRLICGPIAYVVVGMVVSGCVSTRYLAADEQLLRKPRIHRPPGPGLTKRALRQQMPRYNKSGLVSRWLPYMELYQAGLKRFDPDKLIAKRDSLARHYNQKIKKATEGSNKYIRLESRKIKRLEQLTKRIQEGNLWMRLGEPMAIYDTAMLGGARRSLRAYLMAQGYLQPQVHIDTRAHKRHIRLLATIVPGNRYRVGALHYDFADSVAGKDLQLLFEQTPMPLEAGVPYTENALVETVAALNTTAHSHGYYGFDPDEVRFWIDPTPHPTQQVAVHAQLSTRPTGLRQ